MFTHIRIGTQKNVFVPARCVVVQAINQGAVAVLQHRHTFVILHIGLHPDTAKEHHSPEPAIFQGGFKFGKSPLVERRRRNKEYKVHPHIGVVAPRPPAVDKLSLPPCKTMSHPVRGLCSPPDIALESVCHTTLCFPACRPIVAPGCEQDAIIPWSAPRRA